MFFITICTAFATLLSMEEEVVFFQDDSLDQSLQEDCTPPSAREEKDLFSQISVESRRLYNSLDCEGKNRALELSHKYQRKNEAVQEAAKEMGKRQQNCYPYQQNYQKQLEDRSKQDNYDDRYGH